MHAGTDAIARTRGEVGRAFHAANNYDLTARHLGRYPSIVLVLARVAIYRTHRILSMGMEEYQWLDAG